MAKKVTKKQVVHTGQYRKCFNHQAFEMLGVVKAISASGVVKKFSGTEYLVSSVDGNTYPVNLLTLKLWDLILLKLTELVPYKRGDKFQWKEGANKHSGWCILLSIKTIADCLDLSTTVDSLTHLYDRIAAAARVLQNTSITITKGKSSTKIDGYLGYVGVCDCNVEAEEYYLTKSNAVFFFVINPELVAYIADQNMPLYHFNHAWLHLPEHSQNAYAAAKLLGRHYSQNTHKRNAPDSTGVLMDIGTLRQHLPSLKSKKDNRETLDKALKALPGAKYVYVRGSQRLTFEGLKELRLRTPKYNVVKVAVKYSDHPNTSGTKVTADPIKKMNDDALHRGRSVYSLDDDANEVINRRGAIKPPPEEKSCTASGGKDAVS